MKLKLNKFYRLGTLPSFVEERMKNFTQVIIPSDISVYNATFPISPCIIMGRIYSWLGIFIDEEGNYHYGVDKNGERVGISVVEVYFEKTHEDPPKLVGHRIVDAGDIKINMQTREQLEIMKLSYEEYDAYRKELSAIFEEKMAKKLKENGLTED